MPATPDHQKDSAGQYIWKLRSSGDSSSLPPQGTGYTMEEEDADRDCGPRCSQCGGDLPCMCDRMSGSGSGGNLCLQVVAELASSFRTKLTTTAFRSRSRAAWLVIAVLCVTRPSLPSCAGTLEADGPSAEATTTSRAEPEGNHERDLRRPDPACQLGATFSSYFRCYSLLAREPRGREAGCSGGGLCEVQGFIDHSQSGSGETVPSGEQEADSNVWEGAAGIPRATKGGMARGSCVSNAASFSSEPFMYEPGSLMPSEDATDLRPTGATVKKSRNVVQTVSLHIRKFWNTPDSMLSISQAI